MNQALLKRVLKRVLRFFGGRYSRTSRNNFFAGWPGVSSMFLTAAMAPRIS
jgi:hypothetical protein